MVYVISNNKQPLMPCENAVARLLLKQGKAHVKSRTPFVIQLNYDSTNYVQDLTLGVDTGSRFVGNAVVNQTGEVIYLSQVELRNDISDKMKQRSKYRRNRRNRKTRYRPARFLNRSNSIKKDRFSPTMLSKINNHLKEIKFIKSILPITKLVIETATFDPHLLKNPGLKYSKWGYQKGVKFGFANTRAYILARDNYGCQACKGKSGEQRLEVHHIIFKSNGGSDEVSNLITLCKTCHDNLHLGKLANTFKGQRTSQLKHATQMNSIRVQLLKNLECEETFGFITKENRFSMKLPKEHYYDAVAISSGGHGATFKSNKVLIKKCVAKGDFQQSKGVRSEQRIPTGKIIGFRKFDKVRYFGEEYFIKGRMSTGYGILMDIFGKKIDFSDKPKGYKTAKLSNLKRLTARKSWIIKEEVTVNIY